MERLIKNAFLVEESGAFFSDVLVRDGKIAAIGKNLSGAGEVIDAGGLTLLPAFVDLHCFNTKGILFISDSVYHQFKETVFLACLEIVSGKEVECYQLPIKHLG